MSHGPGVVREAASDDRDRNSSSRRQSWDPITSGSPSPTVERGAMLSKTRRDLLILLVLCGVLFGWRLGRVGLMDPDEPFYAESAVEMAESHEALVPRIFGQPQFEKPPMIYWASMVSFGLLGRTEFAGRAPCALCALLLVLMTWAFGARVFGRRAGFLAAIVLATSLAFVVVARMILTDMMLALFVCGSCFAFWLADGDARPRHGMIALALVSAALAVLTKGPIGALVPALAAAVYLLVARRSPPGGLSTWVWGLAAALAIAVPWYAYMIERFGGSYVRAFFLHENLARLVGAEHPSNNHLYYYPAVLIGGALPWIPALAITLLRAVRSRSRRGAPAYLACWILSSLAFFTLAQSKLPTYVLFLFVPMALLMGRTIERLVLHGFESPLERWIALGAGSLQVSGLLAVFAFPEQAGFFVVAGATAGCIALAVVSQMRNRQRAWLAFSAASMVVFVGLALTWSAHDLEVTTSMKPAAMAALTDMNPSRAVLLSSPQLARGLFYYLRRPVTVLTDRAKPFFSPHPLPVVRGGDSLMAFVRLHGPALCFVREREWRRIRPRGFVGDSMRIGDKIIVRVSDSVPGTIARGAQRSPAGTRTADPAGTRRGDNVGSAGASVTWRQPAP